MNDWTVNPPPKESVANRADNRITVGRELPSLRPRGVPDGAAGASTRAESDHAAAAPAAATGRNSRKKCWSDGGEGVHGAGDAEHDEQRDVATSPAEVIGPAGHGERGDDGAGDDGAKHQPHPPSAVAPLLQRDAEQQGAEPVPEGADGLGDDHP